MAIEMEQLMEKFKEAQKENSVELMKEIDEKIEALTKVNTKDRPDDNVEPKDEEPNFPSLGEFIKDVANRDVNEKSAERIKEYVQKELSMDSDPEGGYLVPEKYRAGLLQVSPEEAIVRPRAFVLPAGSPPDASLEMPFLEQSGLTDQSHGDLYGGIWFGWTSEGNTKTNTEIKVGSVEYKPYEWSGYAVLTDKMMRNASQLEAIVTQKYKEGLIGFEDYYFLQGTGVGQPLGVINSPATISVSRNTALHIYYVDICNMLNQFIDSNKAVWVINKACKSEIMNLKDANNNNIFIQGDISKKIPDTLVGIPIKWTFKVPAIGYKGDIGLYDFSKYMIKDGYGPAFDKSKHVYFLSNRTCLKMFGNVDGKPWLKGSLTADDNSTEISPFVVLTTKLA
jgi:HK97 family phage major capsid protein